MNINLTDDQTKTIRASLVRSAERADEAAALALRNSFHDAAAANAFYVKLAEDCRAIVTLIDSQTPTPAEPDAEDTCPDCGEDYGFCQCEEEDEDHA